MNGRLERIFFSILRSALWNTPYKGEVPNEDLEDILKISEQQTVFGHVFNTLSKFKISGKQEFVLNSVAYNEDIKRQNILVNNVLLDFVDSLNKHSIEYIVIKGQTIACLYSNLEHRTCGDIDYLIKSSDYSNVKDVLSKMFSVNFPDEIIGKEYLYIWKNVVFEIHKYLIGFSCKRHLRYWENILLDAWTNPYYTNINGVKVRTLPPTLNAIYIFLHVFFHFMKGGVSLRQMCDWAMILHYYNNDIDRGYLTLVLSQLGVEKAYRAFGSILVDNIGLPEDEFPMPMKDRDKKWRKRILSDIFRGGNFGQQHHRAKTPLGYKFETMMLSFKNCIYYWRLAPSEILLMLPMSIVGNIRLLMLNQRN